MKNLNTYIEEGFFQNVGADLLSRINDIPLIKGASKFHHDDPNFLDLIELAHQFPVGTTLTYKIDAGTVKLKKLNNDKLSDMWDEWEETNAPWGRTRTYSAMGVFKSYYISGNIIRRGIEIEK